MPRAPDPCALTLHCCTVRAPAPCAPKLHYFTVRAPDSCSLKDEHATNHGPSSGFVPSSCYFHYSYSSSRTTVHTQKFERCTQNLARSLPLQLKTNRSFEAHKFLLSNHGSISFLSIQIPNSQLSTDRKLLKFQISTPKASLMLLLSGSWSASEARKK